MVRLNSLRMVVDSVMSENDVFIVFMFIFSFMGVFMLFV